MKRKRKGYVANDRPEIDLPLANQLFLCACSFGQACHIMDDEPWVAKRYAGSEGTVIQVNQSKVSSQIVPRPPVPKYAGEKEVLLKGTIQGRPTTP
jgi:hypothetical protein